jgi:hypothetical protein
VPFSFQFITTNLQVTDCVAHDFEVGDRELENFWVTKAGGGDVDGLDFKIHYPVRQITTITNLQRIWVDLIAQSDPDTVRRLRQDPAYRPDDRILTVQMNSEGTKGFSVTVDQLLQTGTFWIPALDVYLTTGHPFRDFNDHLEELRPFAGRRILEEVEQGAEASYPEFAARWEDMGNPAYKNPAQTGPGHIVGVTWDSAIPKFGIDRTGGVWNDYGNPDRFHSWLELDSGTRGLAATWKGQRLADGLPVLTTEFEQGSLRFELEQFAYPLNGPPKERNGEIGMVLLQELRVTNTFDQPVLVKLRWFQRRLSAEARNVRLNTNAAGAWVEDSQGPVLVSLQGDAVALNVRELSPEGGNTNWLGIELESSFELSGHGARRVVVKLPSPVVAPSDVAKLLALDYTTTRASTLDFWSSYLTRGAQFRVPESAVNELFRANLWHALRLPRRHRTADGGVKLDLPYSNFAYDQRGTPWPVNQAAYVDYMLYGLRGYDAIATEELAAIYANNQEANGHVGGFANWLVYTPAMMYAVAQNFLLSGNDAAFNRLLPQTLRALDWCLAEIERNSTRTGHSRGLVRGPLNDLTGDGIWAFNQAYFYAGLERLGKALERAGHSRAVECATAAAHFREWIERGFGAGMMRAPVVQLRDHTWIPYVACEALIPHRLFQQWYPTDVDTGATHLSRLNALPAGGLLTECLLQDHEDNLYLHGWGMANEPVYNQQATAYLERDQVEAVIRAFYSMMACAFSHSVFEPVEHRWTWGQYFGPPSTDGAWFELYRRMLIREPDDHTLFLLQATPRAWLEDGKQIEIEQAPTYFGPVSLTVVSESNAGRIRVDVEVPNRLRPHTLLIRVRHPRSSRLRSVEVNGSSWTDFDAGKEQVRIRNPEAKRYTIQCRY